VAASPADDSLRFLLPAGVASIAAGVLQVGSVVDHAGERSAVQVLVGLAALQVGWGILAIVHRRRWVGAIGVVLGAVAAAGWVAATTIGIGAVDGLDRVHDASLANVTAAAMATISVAFSAAAMMGWSLTWGARTTISGGLAALLVGLAAVPGLLSLGADETTTDASDGDQAADASDPSSDPEVAAADSTAVDTNVEERAEPDEGYPRPFDPTLPIDLSGAPGVAPEQQAEAENLVAVTLDRLPRYADALTANADGFVSIGDGFTGHEHLLNPAHLRDEFLLDPDRPEALVYELEGGEKTLVAAMFMLSQGQGIEDVPDFGGTLLPWYVHSDLCFSVTESQFAMAGIVGADEPCPAGSLKMQIPMVHVWIAPQSCGPFAPSNGLGAPPAGDDQSSPCERIPAA
jgi:hypothetical protein